MRRLFWVSVALFAVTLAVGAVTLPDRVPVHFGLDGEPDRWASPGVAVLTFAVIGAVVVGLLGAMAHWSSRIPLSVVNIPHKEWWMALPAREQRLRAMLHDDLFGVAAGVTGLLSTLVVFTIVVSHADEPSMNPWGWVVLAAWLVPFLAWLAWVFAVRYLPDE